MREKLSPWWSEGWFGQQTTVAKVAMLIGAVVIGLALLSIIAPFMFFICLLASVVLLVMFVIRVADGQPSMKFGLGSVGVFALSLVFGVMWLAGSSADDTQTATSQPEPTEEVAAQANEAEIPEYEVADENLSEGDRLSSASVVIISDETSEEGTRRIANEVLGNYEDYDAVDVTIAQEEDASVYVARARLANTESGMAALGEIEVGEVSFNYIDYDAEEILAGIGPTAEEAVAAFEEAGLAVPGQRDNTLQNCADLECSQLITTDTVSVYQFPDEAGASEMAEAFSSFPSHASGGLFVSTYEEGVEIEPYAAVLDELASE